MEKLKYVSPQYQQRLEDLSESLAAARRLRLADAALQDTVEFPAITDQLALEIPSNVVVGEE